MKVIVPEASIRPVKTATSPPKSFVRSPVSTTSKDASLDREAEFATMKEAEFATMKAKMEALELAEENRRAELEALQAANNKLQGEVSGMPHCLCLLHYFLSRGASNPGLFSAIPLTPYFVLSLARWTP